MSTNLKLHFRIYNKTEVTENSKFEQIINFNEFQI